MAVKPNSKGVVTGTKNNDKITWTNSSAWKKALTVNAGDGNDTLDFRKSSYKNNKLNGENGNDIVYGGTNIDVIHGNAGDDKLYGYNGNDKIYGDAGNDKLYGGNGDDLLNGGAGNDQLTGGKGKDKLYTGAGNDIVYFNSGDGADTLYKGSGADTLRFNNFANISKLKSGLKMSKSGYNLVIKYTSKDSVTLYNYFKSGVGTSVATLMAKDGKTIKFSDFYGSYIFKTYTGTKNKTNKITGSALNDLIKGNNKNDTLNGGSGNDKIYGYAGNDSIHGNAGNDYIDGGDGNDQLYGDAGNDTIKGGAGKDTIVGYNGANKLYGYAGNDSITGGTGNDYIHAGADNDYVDGGKGNDTILGYSGNNKLYGGAGDDVIYSGTGTDSIWGGAGDDIIYANKGVNIVNIAKAEGHDKIANVGTSTSLTINFDSDIKNVYSYAKDGDYIIERRYNDGTVVNTTLQNFDYNASKGKVTLKYNGAAHALSDSHLDGYDPENSIVADLDENGNASGTSEKSYIVEGDDRGNRVSLTGGGNDIVNAGEGDNKITIEGGSNKVTAGSGNDVINISGTAGDVNNVQVAGGSNTITVSDSEENTVKLGGTNAEDSNTVTVVGKNNTITSAGSNNNITATASKNGGSTITTGAGDDTITLNGHGTSENHVNMGDGTNEITVNSNGASTITGGAGVDTFNLKNGTNKVTTGGGADVVSVTDGTNTIDMTGVTSGSYTATGGTNTVTGSSDINTTYNLNGGSTDLTLNKTVDTQSGVDVSITGGTNNKVTGTDYIEKISITGGSTTLDLGGSADNVTISGGSANNVDLGSGADSISVYGSNGNTIYGGLGNDTISLDKTSNNNKIHGGNAEGESDGKTNNIRVSGTGNEIWAGDGKSVIDPVSGESHIEGDSISVGFSEGVPDSYTYNGVNTVHGGRGNDTIDASVSSGVIVDAGAGNDTIYSGQNGQNNIDGGADNDNISISGQGSNTVYGGLGDDIINLNSVTGDGKNFVYGGEKPIGEAGYVGTSGSNKIYAKNAGNNEIWAGNGDSTGKGDYILVGKRVDEVYYGNNTIHGGSGRDCIDAKDAATAVIDGGAGNDSIYGSSNSNINGGADNDSITIYGGGNTIYGGTGSDVINASTATGNNTIYGANGSSGDDLTDNGSNTIIANNKADNVIYAGNGDSAGKGDSIRAGIYTQGEYDAENEKQLYDFYGNNTVYGGASDDTIQTYGSETAEIYAGNGNDSISGSYNGHTTIQGGEGKDTIYVYNSNNKVSGGAGDDSIYVNSVLDEKNNTDVTIIGGKGNDNIDLGSDVSSTVEIYNGDGNDSVYGHSTSSAGEDTIHFKDSLIENLKTRYDRSTGQVVISHNNSAETPDSVTVGNTNYSIKIKDANGDTISVEDLLNTRSVINVADHYDDGTNSFQGSAYNEQLIGSDNAESIFGDDGADIIYGNSGNDSLYGQNGDDTIYAGDGADSIQGNNGDDEIHADYGNNYVSGDKGNDKLYSGTGNNEFYFNAGWDDGTDTIYSGTGDDTITLNGSYNQSRVDTMFTKDGNDLVINTYKDNDYESNIVVDSFFTNPDHSVKTLKFKNGGDTISLREAHINQKAPNAGGTLTGLDNFNDYLEGSDNHDNIYNVGLGTHGTDGVNDIVSAGAGDDAIYIAENGYAKINIEGTEDEADIIYNVSNAHKVIINFTGSIDTNYIKGYRLNDNNNNYFISYSWEDDGVWKSGAIQLDHFDYENDKDKVVLTFNGTTEYSLDNYDVPEYDGIANHWFKKAFDGEFTTGADDTISYFVEGSSGRDTITTGAGNDFIYGRDGGGSQINAGGGNNRVVMNDGSDTITTGTGNDTIVAGYGSNTINDAGGTNEITVSGSLNKITASGNNTINIVANESYSNPYRNTVTLNGSGYNTVTVAGNSSNDYNTYNINSSGSSTINGGEGADYIDITNGTNEINLNGGRDYVTIEGGSNTINVDDDNNSSVIYVGKEDNESNIIENTSQNIINDGVRKNNYDLYTGSTTLNLLRDEDSGSDYVNIKGGTNTVNGSELQDEVDAYGGTNTLDMNGGEDLAFLYGGTNTVDAGDGVDNIYVRSDGENSANTIYGGLGEDYIEATQAGSVNYIYTGAKPQDGEPYAFSDDASNTVYLGAGTHHVYGGNGIEEERDEQVWNDETEQYDTITVPYQIGDNIYATNDAAGVATIYAGSSDDTISLYGLSSAEVHAGNGNDRIKTAYNGVNYIDAGDGADLITISGGSKTKIDPEDPESGFIHNTILGGAGNDRIEVTRSSYTDGEGVISDIDAGEGNDEIYLGSAQAISSSITFTGNNWGNDTIYESYYNYNYSGRADSINFVGTGDIVSNFVDGGLLFKDQNGNSVKISDVYEDLGSSIKYVNGETLENFVNTHSRYTLEVQLDAETGDETGDNFNGSLFNETITGTSLGDSIYGYSGNDSIEGGAGNDEISGGDGNDTLLGGAGNDDIYDSTGLNTIRGGAGNDSISVYVDEIGENHNTVMFAAGDGTDTITNANLSATLKFEGITDYNNLHITYEYENGTGYKNLVIQYGDNATDKVILQNYTKDSDINVVIDGQESKSMQWLLANQYHIVLPNAASTENNDYIYVDDSVSSVSGGLGNDTIDGIGSVSDGKILMNGKDYVFNKNGEGQDVIINSNSNGTSFIIFTGYTPEELEEANYGENFINLLKCSMSDDGKDLIIKYGDYSHQITIKDFANSSVEYFTFRDTNDNSYSYEFSQYLRLIENVDPDTHIFNGENNKQYDVVGTDGNDTINPGATYYYGGNYGTNIIRPNDGADVIKFTNYYDEETQSYLKSHNEILMGTDETPDTLWFANVTEKSSLNLSREGNNLVIYTREADTSDVEVVLKDFFTYPEPTTFINVKIGDGEGEDNNFKLTDISHQFNIYNYEDKKSEVNGSMFKENIITDKDTAEVINAGAGNDSVHSGSNGLTDYADTINLGDGDDTLSYGYIGNDGMEVYGGDGNDSIEVCSGVVYGGAGSDYIYVGNDNDYRNAHDGAYRNNVTVYGGTSEAGGGNPEDLDSIRGSEGNDLIYGADGSDSIYGNMGNDTIYGNAGNDTIDGYDGDDSIIGGAGADSINGYYGDDTILGGDGNDTIYGGDGDDYIDGGDGDDLIYSDSVSGSVDDYGTIKGGAGNDTIYNNSYSGEVWGDEGDDTITTRYDSYNTNYHFKKGDGHDVINPADSYSYSTNGTIVFDDIAFEEDNITGVLDREAGTLTITYNNGQDSIVVNNYCTNSGGMYDMDAIFGAVQYIVDKNGVKKFIGEFVKMPHEEISGTTTSYTVFSDDITFTGSGSHFGGEGNDTLIGSEYNDHLIGDRGYTTEGSKDGGHDYLDGRGGYNTIYGGQGDDTLVGGYDEKADSLYGGLGTNTYIIATPRVNEAQTEIYSNSEDDILDFSNITNFDAFAVESGDLKMTYSADGKYGYVLIKGWATNPVDYTVKLAGDTTSSLSKIMTESNFMNASFVTGNTETQQYEGVKIGSDGADTITAYYDVNNRSIAVGAAGDDTINGTTNNDVLMGGDGNDYISGKAGDDIIYGGDGNDTIMGSTGTDTIYGGKGSDLIYGGDDADVIFAGTKPMFSIDYINETYAPFTVPENTTYETGADDTSTTVNGEGGNDTIVAFGCNSILYGQDGDDLYHVMYGTNKTTISDTEGSNTLQLHGENNNYHQGYIVMNVKQSDGAITKLMVVDENDYADWKNNNGRLSEGHYGIEITSGIDTFTIKDTSNLSVTGAQIDEFRAAIAGFLEGKEGVTDVAAALGNENYRDDMIAVFDSYNNGGANNMWQ